MSVSFPLRSIFSRFSLTRGFSLVELLISISIIGIITSVVLVKFTDFDSTTILKGTAYEVASSIREAQVLSISVLGAGNTFRVTYGIHFEVDSPNYILFRDIQPEPNDSPMYNLALSNVQTLNTFSMTRGISVDDICVKLSGEDEQCHSEGHDIQSLDISFRRPEFASLYYVTKEDGNYKYSQTDLDTIEHATIKLKSDKGMNRWTIVIGALGHIAVIKD